MVGTWARSIYTVQLQLHLPFRLHVIDPHRPTASTIYLSRVIDPHRPTASTIYISCDRSSPSNCIYHLLCTWSIHPHRPTVSTILHGTWSIRTVQVYQPFWVGPGSINRHRPTAILLYLHRASSKPSMKLGFPPFRPTLPPSSATRFFARKIPTERNEQSNNPPNCFPQLLRTKCNTIPSGLFLFLAEKEKNRRRIQSCDNRTTKIVDDEIIKFL